MARKGTMLVHDDATLKDDVTAEPEVDQRLLAEQRAQAVRDALSCLPWRWRRLVELLMADPPASYAEIAVQLSLPVESIGPAREQCLDRLRELLADGTDAPDPIREQCLETLRVLLAARADRE